MWYNVKDCSTSWVKNAGFLMTYSVTIRADGYQYAQLGIYFYASACVLGHASGLGCQSSKSQLWLKTQTVSRGASSCLCYCTAFSQNLKLSVSEAFLSEGKNYYNKGIIKFFITLFALPANSFNCPDFVGDCDFVFGDIFNK